MAEQLPIDDALLGKFLAGEATPSEAARVQAWLAASPPVPSSADEPIPADFARFEHIWEAATPPTTPAVDTDAAWQNVRRQLRPSETPSVPQSEAVVRPLVVPAERGWSAYWPALRIAALLVLVAGAGWLVVRRQTPNATIAQRTLTTTNQKQTLRLADGTIILLNRNSSLTYPTSFADTARQVTLIGEAFFEVAPDASRPFRIRARQTTVQVVGTSFSVRAYEPDVRVAVRTGKVRFAKGRQTVLLTPNQQATYSARVDSLRPELPVKPNVFAFKTGELVFENEPLRDVIRAVNAEYGADLRLANEQIGNCRLTTRFVQLPLDQVVAITSETLGLRVRRDGERITLEGDVCR
ncbi:FecR domain-containing protein [Hymenobacter terrenus]|uniref:FecR domain-containing protein n=1 Tax=Hymenobacter terrenus TaxID=1629124 RepID=UPI000619F777|nr:FecR domain-containing protein [Hymenobacter terrenus]